MSQTGYRGSGLDVSVTETDYTGNEDRRWLGTRMGLKDMRSITLDASAFLAAHVNVKGSVPSGIALAKLDSGLYAPYRPGGEGALADATAEVQTYDLDDATSAVFKVGDERITIAAADTGAQVLAKFKALDQFSDADVASVVKSGTTIFTVTFAAGVRVTDDLSVVSSTGGSSPTVVAGITTEGEPGAEASAGQSTCAGLLFSTTKLGCGSGLDLATAANVGAALYWTGVVKASFLPTFSGTTLGTLDSAAMSDLPNIRFES